MMEDIKSKDQLNKELIHLRQENQVLSAELAFHRRIVKKLHQALGAADRISQSVKNNDPILELARENEKLKSQLKISKLSDREKQILDNILAGYTSKQIADKLNISKLTVDTHRKHIQQKLEVSNLVELIKIGISLQL